MSAVFYGFKVAIGVGLVFVLAWLVLCVIAAMVSGPSISPTPTSGRAVGLVARAIEHAAFWTMCVAGVFAAAYSLCTMLAR